MIPIPGYDLEVKVTDLEISYKSKKFASKFIYKAIPLRPFVEFCYPPTDRFRGYTISMESIHPSIYLCVHKRIIVHPITPKYPLSYFHETLSGCRGHLVGVSGTRKTILTWSVSYIPLSPKL